MYINITICVFTYREKGRKTGTQSRSLLPCLALYKSQWGRRCGKSLLKLHPPKTCFSKTNTCRWNNQRTMHNNTWLHNIFSGTELMIQNFIKSD